MSVYIEYAFIDNIIINYILIETSIKLAHVKSSFIFRFFSALLGTLVALTIPLFSIKELYLIVIKISLAFLMVYVCGKYENFKRYFLTVFLFIILTFLSGGFIIAIFYFLDIDYQKYFILNYDSVLPIGISVLLIYALSLSLLRLGKLLVKERNFRPFLRNCILVINKKKFKIKGFIDSGNSLYDVRSSLPVVVCSKSLYEKLKGAGLKKSISKMAFDTVSGSSEMQLFIIDELLIYNGVTVNIFNNVLLGVSKFGFLSPDYELLLHPELM